MLRISITLRVVPTNIKLNHMIEKFEYFIDKKLYEIIISRCEYLIRIHDYRIKVEFKESDIDGYGIMIIRCRNKDLFWLGLLTGKDATIHNIKTKNLFI